MSFKALPIKFKGYYFNGSSLKSCFHKRFDYILRFPYDDEEPHHRLVCELHHMNKVPAHFLFKDLAADCLFHENLESSQSSFNVITIPEVIIPQPHKRFHLCLVVKSFKVFPQFDGVALIS